MNLQNDFIKYNNTIQEVFNNWDHKILPHLPQQLDEIAKRTGAMQRKRGVGSAIDLKDFFPYSGRCGLCIWNRFCF